MKLDVSNPKSVRDGLVRLGLLKDPAQAYQAIAALSKNDRWLEFLKTATSLVKGRTSFSKTNNPKKIAPACGATSIATHQAKLALFGSNPGLGQVVLELLLVLSEKKAVFPGLAAIAGCYLAHELFLKHDTAADVKSGVRIDSKVKAKILEICLEKLQSELIATDAQPNKLSRIQKEYLRTIVYFLPQYINLRLVRHPSRQRQATNYSRCALFVWKMGHSINLIESLGASIGQTLAITPVTKRLFYGSLLQVASCAEPQTKALNEIPYQLSGPEAKVATLRAHIAIGRLEFGAKEYKRAVKILGVLTDTKYARTLDQVNSNELAKGLICLASAAKFELSALCQNKVPEEFDPFSPEFRRESRKLGALARIIIDAKALLRRSNADDIFKEPGIIPGFNRMELEFLKHMLPHLFRRKATA